MVVSLVDCKTWHKQYDGSASTKFRLHFNNYKCCHRKYNLKRSVPVPFHEHFNKDGYFGMNDWQFTFIDRPENVESIRIKEAFWLNKLDNFVPNGLNEREVTLY